MNNQTNQQFKEEQCQTKILQLESLLRGLNDDITRMVQESDVPDKQKLWQELHDKANAHLTEIGTELQKQNNRLVSIRRGE